MVRRMVTQSALAAPATQTRPVRLPPLWLFAAFAFVLFVRTAALDAKDMAGYHCYALAFWDGRQAAATLSPKDCLVPLQSISALPLHSFPAEYGPLALLGFLPPLLVPSAWYNIAFTVELALVALALAWLLKRYGAPGAGHMWLLYALIGDMMLAAGRFDTLPAACVVVAIVAARRGNLSLAYVALAIGTLMKYYPAALAPLLLIESWRARDQQPLWRAPALFAAIVVAVEAPVLALDPSGALSPLHFMGARCVQVESLPATLGYLWAHLFGSPVMYPAAFNSVCEQAPGLVGAQAISLALSLVGLVIAVALYWRHQMTLAVAASVIVASLIIGSKVFSPQYVLWISPLVALEFGVDAGALLGWGAVCLCTTIDFPMSYDRLYRLFHITSDVAVPISAAVRNLTLVALTGFTLWRHARGAKQDDEAGMRGFADSPQGATL